MVTHISNHLCWSLLLHCSVHDWLGFKLGVRNRQVNWRRMERSKKAFRCQSHITGQIFFISRRESNIGRIVKSAILIIALRLDWREDLHCFIVILWSFRTMDANSNQNFTVGLVLSWAAAEHGEEFCLLGSLSHNSYRNSTEEGIKRNTISAETLLG